MFLVIAATVFAIIFLGELPDKTMFASLILATRGRPLQVWLGAAAAFAVHVAIATTVGVGVFRLLPHRALAYAVAAIFLLGAVYAWRESSSAADDLARQELAAHRAAFAAFATIFLAEWGDLTQLLTANLAARYHQLWSVGLGAVAALWAVAGIAVIGGSKLVGWLKVVVLRRIMAAVLLGLGVFELVTAVVR